MENLDSRLLAGQEQENDAAGELRRRQRSGAEPGASQMAKKKLEEKVLAPARAATTNRALQWAWKSLIMSWGLTVLWIDAHGLLRMIFGKKIFCKYGEEWLPKQITDAAGSAGQVVNKSIGLVEGMVVIFINVILFFALAILLSFFVNESMLKDIGQEAAQRQTPQAPAVQVK